MPTFDNREGLDSVRTKINAVIETVEEWEGQKVGGSPYRLNSFAELASRLRYSGATGDQINVASGDVVETPDGAYTVLPLAAVSEVPNGGAVMLQPLPGENGLDIRLNGAAQDGVTDDSVAVAATAASCVARGIGLCARPIGTVKLASAVDLSGIETINFEADILVDPAIVGVPVTVGGRANTVGGRWKFADVSDGSSLITGTPPTRPIFRIFGSKSVDIELGNCQYAQFYADAASATTSSNAYNVMRANGIWYQMEFTGAAGVSWNNENFIYAGRIKKLIFDGTNYGHNHNKIYHPTMEGADVDIQFLGTASHNTVYGARLELVSGSAGITFAAGTYSNSVISSWSGNGNPRNAFKPDIPVSDAGMGNMVTTEHALMFEKTPVLQVGKNMQAIGTAAAGATAIAGVCQPFGPFTTTNFLTPELNGVTPIYGNRYVALTDMIPVNLGDVFIQEADYDGSLTRLHVYCFDADMKPLTSEGGGGVFVSIPSYTLATGSGYGYYQIGAALAASALSPITVVRSEVKYIRIGLYLTVIGMIRNYTISLMSQKMGRDRSISAGLKRNTLPTMAGTPTKGFVPLGWAYYDTTAGAVKRTTLAHETTVSGALAAGATSVTVTTIGTVANGDVVGIMMDNGATHWTAVSGLSGSTFTIAAIPTGRSVADQARIVFNRWA